MIIKPCKYCKKEIALIYNHKKHLIPIEKEYISGEKVEDKQYNPLIHIKHKCKK